MTLPRRRSSATSAPSRRSSATCWSTTAGCPSSQRVRRPRTSPALKVLTESEIAKWNTQGLPVDPMSSKNGVIVCRSSRWPLIIDLQLQGIAWVRNVEGDNPDRPLTVVRLENKDILYKPREALENGCSVLSVNMVDKIDADAGSTMVRLKSRLLQILRAIRHQHDELYPPYSNEMQQQQQQRQSAIFIVATAAVVAMSAALWFYKTKPCLCGEIWMIHYCLLPNNFIPSLRPL